MTISVSPCSLSPVTTLLWCMQVYAGRCMQVYARTKYLWKLIKHIMAAPLNENKIFKKTNSPRTLSFYTDHWLEWHRHKNTLYSMWNKHHLIIIMIIRQKHVYDIIWAVKYHSVGCQCQNRCIKSGCEIWIKNDTAHSAIYSCQSRDHGGVRNNKTCSYSGGYENIVSFLTEKNSQIKLTEYPVRK